jgi:hypothetical protein
MIQTGVRGGLKIAVILQGDGFLANFRRTNILPVPTKFHTIIFANLVAKTASLCH